LPTLQEVYPQFNIPKGIVHRKIWEWAFIMSALDQQGMLRVGKRGLGFVVGNEPLPTLFAAKGCKITATDYLEDEDNSWVLSGQNLKGERNALNQYGLCDDETFSNNVAYAKVNMNDIPDDLNKYDFCWSSCAVEHLGNLEKGKKFFINSLKTLRKGGISVHTIEFNNSSNKETIEEGETAIFREKDIEEIAESLKNLGCEIVVTFDRDNQPGDNYIDQAPYYEHNPKYHLHLNIGGYDCTSYGIIIKK